MIKEHARMTIRRIPLECIQIKEYQRRYPERLLHYIDKLLAWPGQYAGVLAVVASDTHPGMYVLLDGHHRFCAAIMAGRKDVLCLVIQEEH